MHVNRGQWPAALKVILVWSFITIYSSTQAEELPSSCKQVPDIKRVLDGYRGDTSVLSEAKVQLDSIIKSTPDCVSAHKELARYHIMSGHISSLTFQPGSLIRAKWALQTALKIDPDYADAYVLFGHLYRLMNKHQEAISSLEKAQLIGTNNPWLHLNWADLLADEGRLDEAVLHYQSIIDSKTDNKKAMGAAFEGLIRYYTSINANDIADLIYLQQIDYEPGNAWAYGNYATFLLYSVGDYEKAIQYSRMALERMNYGVGRQILAASLYRKWAQVLIRENNEQAAQQLFNEAYALYPDLQRIAAYADNSPHTKLTVEAFRKAQLLPQVEGENS